MKTSFPIGQILCAVESSSEVLYTLAFGIRKDYLTGNFNNIYKHIAFSVEAIATDMSKQISTCQLFQDPQQSHVLCESE